MNKLMTPSNIITLLRICLVPVFVVALLSPWPSWFGIDDFISHDAKSVIAAAIFIIISCTDWVDGYLARKRNEVTDFGKFADPLADKILVCAALLALVELQVLPSWPVLIIMSREFIVSGIRMMAASRGEVIAASWYGKAKTVTQIIAIVLFLLKDIFYITPDQNAILSPFYLLAWAVMIVALVLTIVSMLDYISKAGFLFRTNEDSFDVDLEISELAHHVIEVAAKKGITLATAESLTGGGISEALTSISGSSSVVRGGIVSYVNDIKHDVLHVESSVLETLGAVSDKTAEEMAQGARNALSASFSVSATGIAGPTGAEPGKPVGTVYIGVASSDMCRVKRFNFSGDREDVRQATVREALRMLADVIEAE